jgi:hypothetical protein
MVEERQCSCRQFISGYKYAREATFSDKFNAFLATLESAEEIPAGLVAIVEEEDDVDYLAYYFLMDSAFLYYLNPLLVEEPKEVDGVVVNVFLLED